MRGEMAAAKGCVYMYHGRSLDSSAVDTAENKARKLWGQACDLLAHGTDCVHQVRLGFWRVQMQGQPHAMPYAVRDGCNWNECFAVQHAKACTLFVPLFVSTASGVNNKAWEASFGCCALDSLIDLVPTNAD